MQSVTMTNLVGAVLTFAAGLCATLLGLRRLGKRPGVDVRYDAWFARVRPWLLTAGPLLMVLALVLPGMDLSPPAPPEPKWQQVTTADGACRVEMPGSPSSQGSTLVLEGLGEPETTQLKLIQENGHVWYTLSYSGTGNATPGLSAEKLLGRIEENTLALAKRMGQAQLVSEHDLSEHGYPGKELVLDIDQFRMQSKWFLVDKRLYRAIVMTPRDEKHLHDAERFLESFEVLKKPETDEGS